MKKPALLLSLALAALGLVACGEGDDQTIAASETENTRDVLAANNTDYKPCGYFDRYKFAVEGDVSCHRARRVLRAFSHPRPLPGSWICDGPDTRWRCHDKESRARIKAWVTCHDKSPCPGWIKRAVAKRHHRH
jgi:hypothetical protein